MLNAEDASLMDVLKKLSPAKRRRTFHKIVQSLQSVPSSVEELWSSTGARQLTNRSFVNVRIDLLQSAGWDPAGWLAMEWPRLPPKLQSDLKQEFPSFLEILREECGKMVKQLKKEYEASFG